MRRLSLVLAVLTFAVATSLAQSSSVIAYYPFTGNANDASGNVLNGTVSGATLTTDQNGAAHSAYSFDGVDDYIVVSDNALLNPASGIVVEAWIYPTEYPSGASGYCCKQILMKEAQYQLNLGSDGRVSFGIGPYPWVHAYSTSSVPLNQWTRVRGEFDRQSGSIRFYLNGNLQETAYRLLNNWQNNGPLYIGRNPAAIANDWGYIFSGKIDEVRISAPSGTSSSGLVAHWPFDGNTNDASGSGYNGIATNTYYDLDRFGNSNGAIHLNGTSSTIAVPNSSDANVDFLSISAWVKLDRVTAGAQVIAAKWYCGNYCFAHSYVLEILGGTRRPQLTLLLPGYPQSYGKRVTTANVDIPLESWTLITATYDGSYCRIYINGQLDIANPAVGNIVDGTSPLVIGSHAASVDFNGFNGIIDDLRIYDYALSMQEVTALYGDGAPQPTVVTITSPNMLSSWKIGTTQTIRWSLQGNPANSIDVFLSRDGGTSWSTIGTNLSGNTTSLNWVATAPASRNCLITAVAKGFLLQGSDTSPQFQITGDAGYFVHVSDIHIGCGDNSWWQSFLESVDHAIEEPAFVVATGDLVSWGWQDYLDTAPDSAIDNWRNLVAPLHKMQNSLYYTVDAEGLVPVYFSIGNHDLKVKTVPFIPGLCGASARHHDAMAFRTYLGQEEYSVAIPGTSFVLAAVNSGQDAYVYPLGDVTQLPEGTGISNDQLREFGSRMWEGDGWRKIVIMHHPFWNTGGEYPLWQKLWDGTFLFNHSDFADTCRFYDVDLVLGGHVHGDVDKIYPRNAKLGVSNLDGNSWAPESGTTGVIATGSLNEYHYRRIEFNEFGEITFVGKNETFVKNTCFIFACSTRVSVFDNRGNHVGPTSGGDFEYGITGSYYLVDTHADSTSDNTHSITNLVLPRNDSTDYTILVQCLNSEPLNVTMINNPVDGPTSQGVFSQIPVSLGSEARILLDRTTTEYAIALTDPGGQLTIVQPTEWNGNQPPAPASVSAVSSTICANRAFGFSAISTDPDTDQVFYRFDWGDRQKSDWIGPKGSREAGQEVHTWANPGVYQIRAQAKDLWSNLGSWSSALELNVLAASAGQVLPMTWYSTWSPLPAGTIRSYIGNIPVGHTVSSIVPSSIRLNGQVPIYGNSYRVRPSMTGFTGSVLEIAFSRQLAVQSLPQPLTNGTHTVFITGDFTDGNKFIAAVDITLSGGIAKESDEESGYFGEPLPTDYRLGDAHPNPFNPSTTIDFDLPVTGQVKLEVYNIMGQRVRTVVDGVLASGTHSCEWNSNDDAGNRVASGVYLFRIHAGEFTETKKMVLLK